MMDMLQTMGKKDQYAEELRRLAFPCISGGFNKMKAILLFCLSSLVLPQEMDSVQVDTIQQTETDFPEVNLQKDKASKITRWGRTIF